MKTNEFMKEVETIGFEVKESGNSLMVFDGCFSVAVIDVENVFSINTNLSGFDDLEETKKQKLFNLLTEYASTPIESREEEKKYAYRFKNKVRGVCLNRGRNLLSYSESGDKWYLSDGCNLLKTKFTHSELKSLGVDIEQLQEVYEEIEVEE